MSDKTPEVVAALLLCGGAAIQNGYRRFRLRRLVEDMPTHLIQSAPQGFVEVQGEAFPLAGKSVKGLGGAELIYAHFQAQRYIRRGKSSRWETMFECRLGERFVIRDKSGWAHVLMKGGELELEETIHEWHSMGLDDQETFLRDILPRMQDLGWGETIGSGEWRLVEKSIRLGECVYALGCFKTRQSEPQFDVEHPIGQIAQVRPLGGIMKSGVHPLVIADCHQPDFLDRIGRWSVIKMVGGAAAIALGVYFFIDRYLPNYR